MVKNLKKITEVLSDKKTHLQKFIKDRQMNSETEENFLSLLNYYNSIQ
jgi:hypothetical protein